MRRPRKQIQPRRFDIELEIEHDDIAYLIRQLGITVQAARSLLVNPDRVSVREQIGRIGSHLNRRRRDELTARVFYAQRDALRLKRQINA